MPFSSYCNGADAGCPRFHHIAHETNGLDLVWPPVDEVADEDGRSLRVPPGTIAFTVAKLQEQRLECFHMAVDIANDIVH